MKKHKSYHIFMYLGLLVLLFLLIFGIQYFKSQYSFKEVEAVDNTQDYEDGVDSVNPFKENTKELNHDWQRFKGNDISFSYPREYQLMIGGKGTRFYVTAPYVPTQDCNNIKDEQARALCTNPPLSPDVTIRIIDSEIIESPFVAETNSVLIGKDEWQRESYQDEYGGSVWFRKSIGRETIEVSFRYRDVDGGVSFEELHNRLGAQYQLDQKDQERLTRGIIETIEL